MKNNITKIEYLSAVLDDEAGPFEQKRIIKELQQDESMLDKVASFSLIGEAMRNEGAACAVQPNFLAGIQAEIAEEPAYNNIALSMNKQAEPWSKSLVRMGVAAGLVAVALISFNLLKPFSGETLQQQVGTEESSYMIATNTAEPYVRDEEWREKIRLYVDQHAKSASSAIMPSVRAISYSANY